MNVFDIIIATLLLFGFVKGLIKGLFIEIASITALIGGIYGSIHFSYFTADFLKEFVSWKKEYISLVSFAITFIIIIIIISLAGKALTKMVNFASLGILNKILGAIFGALKIGLILSIIFAFFSKINGTIPFVKKEILEKSILYNPVKKIVPTIFPIIFKKEKKEKPSTEKLWNISPKSIY